MRKSQILILITFTISEMKASEKKKKLMKKKAI